VFEKSTSDARPIPADPHRCLAGAHCRDAAAIDGQRVGKLVEQQNTLCDTCRGSIASAIKQLPKDWDELHRALGDRNTTSNTPVRSTPAPAVPISTTKAALMAEIVELADRAATITAAALDIDPPTGRRNTAPKILVPDPDTGKRQPTAPVEDSPAWTAETAVTPDALQTLRACLALIEPQLDTLAAAPAESFTIWDRPGEETDEPLKRDDTGQPVSAKGRLYVDITGLDALLDLADIHHKIRAELGKTKLRHKLGFPCPRCGSEVGRDDGTTIVDCKNPSCQASWTEREFKFLQGLELEGREKEISKWLLAEAYSRLDGVARLLHTLETDEELRDIEAVQIIRDALKPHIDGHQPPHARDIATDEATTRARALEEEGWSWRNETPWKPPKRKKQKPKPPPEVKYAPSSLALDTPINLPGPDDTRANACPDCNCIHAGECA
jgi:hypothetical protein